jgi:hypothetical protein
MTSDMPILGSFRRLRGKAARLNGRADYHSTGVQGGIAAYKSASNGENPLFGGKA